MIWHKVRAVGNKLGNPLKTCKFYENTVKISWELTYLLTYNLASLSGPEPN
jgi:hypothetical protein